jgi:putative lipoprotein
MNRALVVVSTLGALLLSGRASASDADPWFGPDKALHFGVSVVLSAGGYAASSIWLDRTSERVVAGSAFSLTLGAGKELWDLAGHGDPSWRDFTWDVIGTGVGIALAVAGDALLSSKPGPGARASTQGLVLRF